MERWEPLYSEPVNECDGDAVWFVVKGMDDHHTYFETEAEAQACADELNAAEVK